MSARRTACFDDEEWTTWEAFDRLVGHADRAVAPCEDCSFAFHRAMVAEGRCDGVFPRALIPLTPAQERRRAQWRAYNAKRL